jgi:hypothetical protein
MAILGNCFEIAQFLISFNAAINGPWEAPYESLLQAVIDESVNGTSPCRLTKGCQVENRLLELLLENRAEPINDRTLELAKGNSEFVKIISRYKH